MKRIMSVVILVLAAIGAKTVAAHTVVNTKNFTVLADETLLSPIVVFANEIRFEGLATDDIFLFAERIDWTGNGSNDVWAVGNEISLTGNIHDHARLGGRTIRVSGVIGNGLVAVGGTVRIGSEANIKGGVTVWAEDALVAGNVEGPLSLSAGSVTLGGVIRGHIRIRANDIRALPGTRIEGDLVYVSSTEFIPGPRVTITGKVARSPLPPAPRRNLAFPLFLYAGALLVGIPFVLLFPDFAGAGARLWRHSFFSSLAAGALALGLIPMLALLAMVSYVGIPLALVLSATSAVLLFLSQFTAALALGGVLLRRRGPQGVREALLVLAAGLAALYVFGLVPMAGSLIFICALLAGFGAVLRALLRTRQEPIAGGGAFRAAEISAVPAASSSSSEEHITDDYRGP